MKRTLNVTILVALILLVVTSTQAEAVICLACNYINDAINRPFYWLDCYLFGGSVWGQC